MVALWRLSHLTELMEFRSSIPGQANDGSGSWAIQESSSRSHSASTDECSSPEVPTELFACGTHKVRQFSSRLKVIQMPLNHLNLVTTAERLFHEARMRKSSGT